MTMPADRERDRRSLQDLAKMAQGLTPPPPSVAPAPSGVQRAVEGKKDDSGIVDLAAASQADPSAALRAQSTPLASQGLFDEEPAHSQRPPMSAPVSQAPHTAPLGAQGLHAQPAPSIPPVPASIPPASLPPQALTPSAAPVGFGAPVAASAVSTGAQKKKGGGAVIALVIGGVVALSAAAAGGLFVMKSRNAAVESAAATVTTTQPAVTVAQAEPPPAKAEPATEPADTTPAPEPSTDPNALPTTHGKIAMAPKAAKGGSAAAKHEAPAPAPKPEGPAKMTEKDLAPSSAGPAGDLGAAIKKEVGDDGTPKTPAAATTANTPTGNVPTKPSQGAVTGALGAVLPGARACLGPDDPVSRASVVFSSAGTVQSVNVSGAAAGKPAEACIKGALMKAKVAPFAEPTYTANVTVRHN